MSERIEQLKKRESKYVQTQPLYQNYWFQSMHGDPTRPGKTSSVVDMTLSLAGVVVSSVMNSSSSQFSPKDSSFISWHTIPEVKESGLLDLISIREYKLQEAMFEVITSEASYLRSLTIAVSHFSKCPEMLDMLTLTERHTLFSNLQEVKDTSERFLLDLEERLGENLLLTDISDIVLWHCADFRRVYIPYVTNQMYQEKMIQQLVLSEEFVQVLKKLEAHPICQQQLLKSFLILPFQRITRLKIMLENILMLNPPESPVADSVRKAVEAIGEIIHECNENVKRMRQIEELVSLEKQMEFSRTKSFPLISQTRFLVKEGELDEISGFESGHTTGSPTRPVYLHLFNDLLLLSRKDNGRFSVLDYARIWKVRAHCFEAKSLVFALCLVENHKGTNRNFIVGAGNEYEIQEWVAAISTLQ
ncbi:rho guanine nucleotide exchange factor 19 isoform X3 [Chiloscyllium plagiosum]|uniref:rho guanine nucleotide exchange factor 19 isoform X3 n=1 Tax=Chiloscyllium plagiosum TaxID=36176 RepID=UPI001CB7E392|nr:rho guanine nucleotide exchange factor 19 isoform X3 [Chiloscyllium plagiosum]